MGRGQRKCPSAIIAMSALHRGRRPRQTRFGRGSPIKRSRKKPSNRRQAAASPYKRGVLRPHNIVV